MGSLLQEIQMQIQIEIEIKIQIQMRAKAQEDKIIVESRSWRDRNLKFGPNCDLEVDNLCQTQTVFVFASVWLTLRSGAVKVRQSRCVRPPESS